MNGMDETRYVHAEQAQLLFNKIAGEAEGKGMRLNASKTTMLCISAARSFKPVTYIELGDSGDVVVSGREMKLLGFHFDSSPGVGAHVEEILKKVRYRTWALHNLKRLGLCPAGLLNVYTSLVRPCFDFACVVYHLMLTKNPSNKLERMQRKIMKIIYGYEESYSRCLGRAGLDLLSARRSKLAEKFAIKAARNPSFADWFPLNGEPAYPLRRLQKYREFTPRTERLRVSPIFMYRRLLNAQESE